MICRKNIICDQMHASLSFSPVQHQQIEQFQRFSFLWRTNIFYQQLTSLEYEFPEARQLPVNCNIFKIVDEITNLLLRKSI